MDLFSQQLNEEEKKRYDDLKELATRLYPQIQGDNIAMNLSEYLFLYYAKFGCLPEPQPNEKHEKSEPLAKVLIHQTPADAGSNLKFADDDDLNTSNIIIG